MPIDIAVQVRFTFARVAGSHCGGYTVWFFERGRYQVHDPLAPYLAAACAIQHGYGPPVMPPWCTPAPNRIGDLPLTVSNI